MLKGTGRKTVALLMVLMFFLSGCGLMDKQTGLKRTIFYDENGRATHSVDEDKAVGDKYTEYSEGARGVAKSVSDRCASQVQGIIGMSTPSVGASPESVAYGKAMAYMAISNLECDVAGAIKALYYGKDGYDVADTTIGTLGKVLQVGAVAWGVDRVLSEAFRSAGDNINVSGDNNSLNKTTEINEIHANTTGENSPPVVDNSRHETIEEVVEEEEEEEVIEEEVVEVDNDN